ncbi:unnamed protein product [Durusdinium trenchii]|uniref:Uncharacterized protein n=1 Tax=Durusdinium trenchii TaxID=1381693 RepID=A0ABP0M0A9_9DINO
MSAMEGKHLVPRPPPGPAPKLRFHREKALEGTVKRLPRSLDDATTPSLQKMQDERDFERQRRSKFHGRALQWSRTVGEDLADDCWQTRVN